MKKSLIAGAGVAALGLAVVPFAGVFAADPVSTTDTIKVTVAEACSFSTGGDNQSVTSSSTAAGAEATLTNATHKFVINCNSNKYDVTATASNLSLKPAVAGAQHTTIAFKSATDYASAASSKADDGAWTATITGDNVSQITTAGTETSILSGKATTTDTFTATYKAYVGAAQTQGTYEGTIVYTLTGSNDIN